MSEDATACATGAPCRSCTGVIPNRAQSHAARAGSRRRASAAPGDRAIAARAAFTRPRRSARRRAAARSSASGESSGRPLVTSARVKRPRGASGASSSLPGRATRDSRRLLEPSRTRGRGARGPSGEVGLETGGSTLAGNESRARTSWTGSPRSRSIWFRAIGGTLPCHVWERGSHRRPIPRRTSRTSYVRSLPAIRTRTAFGRAIDDVGEFGEAIEGVPVALGALSAVIDAQQARRARDERCERGAGPCPHYGRAGGSGRATLMWDARGRGPTALSARWSIDQSARASEATRRARSNLDSYPPGNDPKVPPGTYPRESGQPASSVHWDLGP